MEFEVLDLELNSFKNETILAKKLKLNIEECEQLAKIAKITYITLNKNKIESNKIDEFSEESMAFINIKYGFRNGEAIIMMTEEQSKEIAKLLGQQEPITTAPVVPVQSINVPTTPITKTNEFDEILLQLMNLQFKVMKLKGDLNQ